jgi:hypothetical protein
MTQNNKDLHEVEDPNSEYYEPKPEGEKSFWKRHLVNKHKDRNGNGSDVFSATNIGKDKSRLKGDPKADLDDPIVGNRPIDQLKDEKGTKKLKEDKMNSAEKAKREDLVKAMKSKTAGFKDRYGDNWKNVMYATATKNAMEEVELEEGPTSKEIKMAAGIANDKRYIGGNMTGATNAIEKIRKGLSSHPKVSAALQRANEETVVEDSQSASSDNPGAGGGQAPTTGTVDNNNSHLNNNPTGDPPKKGDVKDTLEAIAMQAAELHDKLEDGQEIDSQAQAMLSEAKDALDQVYEIVTNGGGAQDAKAAPTPKNGGASANVKEDFEYVDDSEELFEELEVLDEATVKDNTGTIVGTHKPGEGFKPNALGKKLGHKAHPTDVPSGTTITKRGRKVGSKSFGASKRKDQTSDEAGAHSEKPSFTDQLLKATDTYEGGHVTFDNGKTHHIPRVHARNALYHLGKPEKPADKNKVRKHIGASKENFDSFRKSDGQLPKEAPKYDPDAKIKARTAQITSGTKKPRSAATVALAQKILARRKAGK